MSVTMFRSSPMNALTIDDFPAFGRPTIAKRGRSSSCSSSASFLKSLTSSSRTSPEPSPLIAERMCGSPSPSP